MLETLRTTAVMMMLMKNNIIVDLGFKNPIFPEDNTFLLLFTMVQFNSKAIHLTKSTLIIHIVVTKGDKVEQKSLQSVKTVPQDKLKLKTTLIHCLTDAHMNAHMNESVYTL